MYELKIIKQQFGFDKVSNVGDYHEELEELAAIRKRVKRKYTFAKFARPSYRSIAIQLTPASMCWDAVVEFQSGGYVVKTVSTMRDRDISYDDRDRYGIGYGDTKFVNITTNINRVMKLINETISVTGERVLERAMQQSLVNFDKGLRHAQGKLSDLQSRVFSGFRDTLRNEMLLEYCLATMEQRPVRGDVRNDVEGAVRDYLEKKKDLGESITASEGLQVLSLFKIEGNDKVFFHYRDTTAGEMQRIKHVDDVNKLPQEVLAKAAVLQTTGRDAMDSVGYSYSECRVLSSIGAVSDCENLGFMDTAMCVYVSPETMAEVEALVGY
jgi:hypothetical protein